MNATIKDTEILFGTEREIQDSPQKETEGKNNKQY